MAQLNAQLDSVTNELQAANANAADAQRAVQELQAQVASSEAAAAAAADQQAAAQDDVKLLEQALDAATGKVQATEASLADAMRRAEAAEAAAIQAEARAAVAVEDATSTRARLLASTSSASVAADVVETPSPSPSRSRRGLKRGSGTKDPRVAALQVTTTCVVGGCVRLCVRLVSVCRCRIVVHTHDFCAVMLHRLPLTREHKSARRMLLNWKPLKRWVPIFA